MVVRKKRLSASLSLAFEEPNVYGVVCEEEGRRRGEETTFPRRTDQRRTNGLSLSLSFPFLSLSSLDPLSLFLSLYLALLSLFTIVSVLALFCLQGTQSLSSNSRNAQNTFTPLVSSSLSFPIRTCEWLLSLVQLPQSTPNGYRA